MENTIDQNNKSYWFWAGPANDGAREGFCVHCRGDQFGVTKYIDSEPSKSEAREIAESLIPEVDRLH